MRPERLFVISASAILACCSVSVSAQIYKCEGADGVVEYSNSPPTPKSGRTCRTIEVGPITVIPAPKPAVRPPPAATAAGSRPNEGFPKVDPATQRARDDDRRRILQDELGKEEARLTELRKEYNNGEPERQGNERNYQKYLDRVQRLKDDIERAEANVGTIRKELSALKP